MNSNPPNNHHESLEPVATNDGKLEHNRKQRRNFDRIKRKAKRSLLKAGYKVKR